MAHLPVITNTYRCALEWIHTNGQTAANVIHVRVAGSSAHNVFLILDANVDPRMWSPVGNGGSVTNIKITPLDGTSPTQDFAPTTPADWTGGTGGNVIPQSAAVVKLTTNSRGRSYRGRVFLPWVAESAQTDGRLGNTQVTDTQDGWDAFVTGIQAAPGDLVVASYKHATAEAVSGLLAEAETGTQRRRQSRNR